MASLKMSLPMPSTGSDAIKVPAIVERVVGADAGFSTDPGLAVPYIILQATDLEITWFFPFTSIKRYRSRRVVIKTKSTYSACLYLAT